MLLSTMILYNTYNITINFNPNPLKHLKYFFRSKIYIFNGLNLEKCEGFGMK